MNGLSPSYEQLPYDVWARIGEYLPPKDRDQLGKVSRSLRWVMAALFVEKMRQLGLSVKVARETWPHYQSYFPDLIGLNGSVVAAPDRQEPTANGAKERFLTSVETKAALLSLKIYHLARTIRNFFQRRGDKEAKLMSRLLARNYLRGQLRVENNQIINSVTDDPFPLSSDPLQQWRGVDGRVLHPEELVMKWLFDATKNDFHYDQTFIRQQIALNLHPFSFQCSPQALEQHGAPASLSYYSSHLRTPLEMDVRPLALHLWNRCPPTNYEQESLDAMLLVATYHENGEMIEKLLEAGATIHPVTWGYGLRSPVVAPLLYTSLGQNNPHQVPLPDLQTHQANMASNSHKRLKEAVIAVDRERLREYLREGANINALVEEQTTILHFAIEQLAQSDYHGMTGLSQFSRRVNIIEELITSRWRILDDQLLLAGTIEVRACLSLPNREGKRALELLRELRASYQPPSDWISTIKDMAKLAIKVAIIALSMISLGLPFLGVSLVMVTRCISLAPLAPAALTAICLSAISAMFVTVIHLMKRVINNIDNLTDLPWLDKEIDLKKRRLLDLLIEQLEREESELLFNLQCSSLHHADSAAAFNLSSKTPLIYSPREAEVTSEEPVMG